MSTELPKRLADYILKEFGKLPESVTYSDFYGYEFWIDRIQFAVTHCDSTNLFYGDCAKYEGDSYRIFGFYC